MNNLRMETQRKGNGQYPKPGNTVSVHYTGRLTDGTVFDSSYKRGKPFQFKLGAGKVIRGWDIGVAKMSKGQVCRLRIPPNLAYGNRSVGGVIPANATLIFTIELLGIK